MRTYQQIINNYIHQKGVLANRQGYYFFQPDNISDAHEIKELCEDCVIFKDDDGYITVVPYALLVFRAKSWKNLFCRQSEGR